MKILSGRQVRELEAVMDEAMEQLWLNSELLMAAVRRIADLEDALKASSNSGLLIAQAFQTTCAEYDIDDIGEDVDALVSSLRDSLAVIEEHVT